MSTQQTDALQCAADLEYSIARHGMQDAFTLNAYRAMKMVRTQLARITELESQLAQCFVAADMATAAAQGFRDGVASVSVESEPVPNNRRSLEDVFRRLSDRAYCNFIEQIGSDVCLGWKYKARHGMFGEAELKGHTLAGEMLGRHKAFAEAANALRGSDAPLTDPSPQEGMAGWTTLPGQMPEPNTPVLLDIGKKFMIRALWAEKHTVRVGTDVDDWGEYDEETDEYYCPEGWYEWNEHEEVHWAVSETPRAWRELPQPLPAATGPADGESNG